MLMIKTGEDEFCTNCMDWRSCNENGECIICGKKLKKTKHDTQGYGQIEQDSDYDEDEVEDT